MIPEALIIALSMFGIAAIIIIAVIIIVLNMKV